MVMAASGGGGDGSGDTEVIILISDSDEDELEDELSPNSGSVQNGQHSEAPKITTENGQDRESPSLLENGHEPVVIPVIKPELPQANLLYNRTHYTVSPVLVEMTAKANSALSRFLAICQPLMSKGDRDLILKRVDTLVQQSNLHYLASDQFHNLVQELTRHVSADKANVYVHMKTLTDELRAYREKRPKPRKQGTTVADGVGTVAVADGPGDAETAVARGAASDDSATDHGGTTSANPEEAAEGSSSATSTGTPSAEDLRRQRQIRLLEKHLCKLHKAIGRLRQKEVDWEDDASSAYVMEGRYKKKCLQVWRKLCELQGRRPLTGRESDSRFHYSGSRYPEINEAVSTMINKKKMFPDFTDVLGLVRSHNQLSGLGLQSPQVEQIAKDVFLDVGQQLQARRQREELRLALLYLEDAPPGDPAEADEGLRAALEHNARLCRSRMDQLVQTFVDRQLELKLEAQDVGEEDCDQSPPPSPEDDDEDQEDLVSLQDDLSGVEDSPGEVQEESGEEKAEDEPDASGVDGVLPLRAQPCTVAVPDCPGEAEVITIASDDEASPPAKKART